MLPSENVIGMSSDQDGGAVPPGTAEMLQAATGVGLEHRHGNSRPGYGGWLAAARRRAIRRAGGWRRGSGGVIAAGVIAVPRRLTDPAPETVLAGDQDRDPGAIRRWPAGWQRGTACR
jgi:hypothetical protein